jgi:predicted small secreted protein
MSRLTKIVLASLFAGSAALLTGCNMVDGMGRDISAAAVNTQQAVFGTTPAQSRPIDEGYYY